ncbi:Anaphase-promoting complex subunit 4 [Podila humilis]|nr:Anaphase-promoting complex subunit 4 [Podila humilis]
MNAPSPQQQPQQQQRTSPSSHVSMDSTAHSRVHSSFSVYTENKFKSPHKLQAWCPMADVLAVVNKDNELELYRLSWEKHWSIHVRVPHIKQHGGGISRMTHQGGAEVVSLAWRPDGKMIAVGLASGHINVYDYMDGSLARTIAPRPPATASGYTPSSAEYLKWTEVYLGPSSQTSFFGIQQSPTTILAAMPLLSPVPTSSLEQETKAQMMFAKHRRGAAARGGFGSMGSRTVAGSVAGLSKLEDVTVLDEESQAVMNTLFSSDCQGRFRLTLFGGFETEPVSLLELVQQFSPRQKLQFKAIDVLAADIKADLSELGILAVGATSAETDGIRKLLQITLRSEILRKHTNQVRSIGVRIKPVRHLVTYMEECIEVMKKDYNKLCQLAEICTDSVQDCLTMNGVTSNPMTEFEMLLLKGRPSVSLDQYLQQDLGHVGVKRWNKSAKAANDRYGALGLDEKNIYGCIKLAGNYIGTIEQLFQALKVEIKQFHEFENWLEQVVENVQPTARAADDADEGPKRFLPVDTLSVHSYLQSVFGQSELRKFFKERVATHDSRRDHDMTIGSSLKVSTPTYPIVFPFARELDKLISDLDPSPSEKPAMKKTGYGIPDSDVQDAHATTTFVTLEESLKVLARHSFQVFEVPSSIVSGSFKVVQMMDMSLLDDGTGNLSNGDQPRKKDIKVAMRYCYKSMDPWLYVAFYNSSKPPQTEPYLCVLRSRSLGSEKEIITQRSSKGSVLKFGATDSSGRKRKASNTPLVENKISKKDANILSPGPVSRELSSLSLKSPEPGGDPNTCLVVPDDHDSLSGNDAGDLTTEVMYFSLRKEDVGITTTPAESTHDGVSDMKAARKWFEIRDIVFLDHDNLALLTNMPCESSRQTAAQHLALMPLESTNHKYASVVDLNTESDDGGSMLDRLASTFIENQSGTHAEGLARMPIAMSREVTYPEARDTIQKLSDATKGDAETWGPSRIACNERGKSRVLSLHGSTPQGAEQITIFDL